MGWNEEYQIAKENSRRVHTDYMRGYVDSFEATIGVFHKLLYSIRGEPPQIVAYREMLSERKDLTERLTPS